jgi:hypothetical protein
MSAVVPIPLVLLPSRSVREDHGIHVHEISQQTISYNSIEPTIDECLAACDVHGPTLSPINAMS